MYGDLDRPPLHAEVLERALVAPGSIWSSVEVVESSPSTNADLVDRAGSSDVDGVVLIAEHQTAGRGRLQRTWTAPARSGLTMSALVRPDDVAAARWPWIPLLAGLAVAATLRRDADVPATLKWPNDVLIEERKVAGLLVERVEPSAGRGRPAAVIGIGLNVSLTEAELPVPTATSLVLAGASATDRSLLARGVLRSLEGLLLDWYRHGGDPARRAPDGVRRRLLDARAAGPGRPAGRSRSCGARRSRVDDTGRLVVQTAEGQVAVGAGDVLHLRSQT